MCRKSWARILLELGIFFFVITGCMSELYLELLTLPFLAVQRQPDCSNLEHLDFSQWSRFIYEHLRVTVVRTLSRKSVSNSLKRNSFASCPLVKISQESYQNRRWRQACGYDITSPLFHLGYFSCLWICKVSLSWQRNSDLHPLNMSPRSMLTATVVFQILNEAWKSTL